MPHNTPSDFYERTAEDTPYTAREWRVNDEKPRPLVMGDSVIYLGKAFFLLIADTSLTIQLDPSYLGPQGWKRLEEAFNQEGLMVTYVYEADER
jgi:hypothetical protein